MKEQQGHTDLHEHMEFLRFLRGVFPSFSALLLLGDGFEMGHADRTGCISEGWDVSF